MTTKLPAAPSHLSASAKRLWKEILKYWRIEDAAHLSLLRVALESRDRGERCRKRINDDGEVVEDRFGQSKPHPLLACERDSRAGFVTALSRLGLDPNRMEE